jgi:hypothetical protein
MSGGSAARAWDWRRPGLGPSHADLPVALRWREAASLGDAIRRSLMEPDFTHANDADAPPDGARACFFLAPTTLLGRQPGYAVAVVDQEGRLRFKETLQFHFAAALGRGPRRALPDFDAARRLERLGALLSDQTVYAPDELAADLDGLREPLSRAFRLHSLSPLLARKARAAGGTAAQALLEWVDRGFDTAADPGARAQFMRQARDWAATGAEQGRT